MPQLKTLSARGASNSSAFAGKWATVISLIHGVSTRFHLVVFVIGVNQEKWEAGRVQDYEYQLRKASTHSFQL